MLIRLFPESPETPTILFSLSPASPTSNIPLPSYYNSQLETLGSYGLPPPRSVYALDKAGWALALLEEVVFDLAVGKIGVKWVDGGVEEWEMEEFVEGKRSALRKMLFDVVRGVKESEQRREDEKREELVVSLLQTIPNPENAIPAQALRNIHRPSSRLLRRQARSTLLDAFRIHVVHHLSHNHRHRSSYPLWIARRCLEALIAEYGPVHDLDDDEESLGTDETFEDSMDMDMGGEIQTTPNTSVDSITPCDDPESMDSPNDFSDSEPTSPGYDAAFEHQDCGPEQLQESDTGGFDPESDKENDGPAPSANNNPYPSLPVACATTGPNVSQTRLPLSESDFEVTPDPGQSNGAPVFPVQLPPHHPPEPPYNPQPQTTFIQTVHLHTLISHLEYEEDRARVYLDPETNPDNYRFRSGAAGTRGRRPSSLRNSFSMEDLVPVFNPTGEVEDYGDANVEDGESEIEAVSDTDGLRDVFQVETIGSLNPPAEPIFSYESDGEDDSDSCDDSGSEATDGEAGLYLSTPPTSEDESVMGSRQGHLTNGKKPFFVKRKPSPSPDAQSAAASPELLQAAEMKRVFFSAVPLPPDVEDDKQLQEAVAQLVDVDDDAGVEDAAAHHTEKIDIDSPSTTPASASETFLALGLVFAPSAVTSTPVEETKSGNASPEEEVEDLFSPPVIPDENGCNIADEHDEHDDADKPGREGGHGDDEASEANVHTDTIIQAAGLEMDNTGGAPSHSYGDDGDEGIVEQGTPDMREGEAAETVHDFTNDPDLGLTEQKTEDVEMDHAHPAQLVTSPYDSDSLSEMPRDVEGGEAIQPDRGTLNDDFNEDENNNHDLDGSHDHQDEEVMDDETKAMCDDQKETCGLAEHDSANRPDDGDPEQREERGETEMQVIPVAEEAQESNGGVGDPKDNSEIDDQAGIEQEHHEMDTCAEIAVQSEQSLEMPSPSREDIDSDGEEEMFDIDLDAPEQNNFVSEETIFTPVTPPPQARPPSPAPFISPRSLGMSAPAMQYDFEWGKHSPLARAVLIKNWNNPMDSDEMY